MASWRLPRSTSSKVKNSIVFQIPFVLTNGSGTLHGTEPAPIAYSHSSSIAKEDEEAATAKKAGLQIHDTSVFRMLIIC
jgi:hypothetical protein